MATKISLKIVLIILLLGCLLPMPYGYFQLVRFVAMGAFLIFAYYDRNRKDKTIIIFWILCAALFNPFFKVALGRTIWNIVDVVLAIVLLFSMHHDKKKHL